MIAWITLAGLVGGVVGVFYLSRKNVLVTIVASQLLLYSGAIGFMGWQQYKWRGRKDGRRHGQAWERVRGTGGDESEELENGWNRRRGE
jgi:hypothetical protein